MEDLSNIQDRVTALSLTGQGTDEVSDLSVAMTAPGTASALGVVPERDRPARPLIESIPVTPATTLFTGDMHAPGPDGSVTDAWTNVSHGPRGAK